MTAFAVPVVAPEVASILIGTFARWSARAALGFLIKWPDNNPPTSHQVPPSRLQRASALPGNETVAINYRSPEVATKQRSTAIYIVIHSLTECPKHRHAISLIL